MILSSPPSPVFQEFIKLTNHDVEHAIKKRMSGDVRDAFVAIGQCSLRAAAPSAVTAKAVWQQIPAALGPWRLPVGHGLGHLQSP